MITKLNTRQMINSSALSVSIGSSVGAQLDVILALIDNEMATLTSTQTLSNKTFASSFAISGSTSGIVTIDVQAVAGTYNFNLPITSGTIGQALTSQGGGATPMTWSNVLTNPMTTLGDIIYENATPAPTRLAGNTTTAINFLSQTGTGLISAPPVWKTFTAPTIQKFLSGSGTYTTPADVLYIKVRVVGGGAGGGGANTDGTAGGNGGDTTFGSSLIVANGGFSGNHGGGNGAFPGGSGGSASLGIGPIGIAVPGSDGASGQPAVPGASLPGGNGGASFFGGGASGVQGTGNSASANTGSGGGGGGSGATNISSGGGGGAGGYVEAIIYTPSPTYAYSVGTGGTLGGGGSSSDNGGTGGSGLIIVEEYYQ